MNGHTYRWGFNTETAPAYYSLASGYGTPNTLYGTSVGTTSIALSDYAATQIVLSDS